MLLKDVGSHFELFELYGEFFLSPEILKESLQVLEILYSARIDRNGP